MFGFGGSVKIYYCPTPVNMRKSFDGLAGAVEEYIKQDPESGHVFAFFSRNKKLVKLLQWEDGGFVIWMKKSDSGHCLIIVHFIPRFYRHFFHIK